MEEIQNFDSFLEKACAFSESRKRRVKDADKALCIYSLARHQKPRSNGSNAAEGS